MADNSDRDRLEMIAELLKQPRDYFRTHQRPIKPDYENQSLPLLEAIELLAAEVRDIRDRL